MTHTGGALSAGTYRLANVAVLGSPTFCSDTYVQYDHRGTLRISAVGKGTATFEFLDSLGKTSVVTKDRPGFIVKRFLIPCEN